MDEKELKERETAARRKAKEDESFYVDYVHDCVNTSVDAMRDVRETMELCYEVFQELEPETYGEKESWQSRVVVPKPFATVLSGAASIKKAFSPNFLTIKDKLNPDGAEFWQEVMRIQTDELHADFLIQYIKSLIMALAVGVSMEMIPRYNSRGGLSFDLIEPWKIHRDPDAPNMDPQGGLYWVHQEWFDYFVLKDGESDGLYQDVDRVLAKDGDAVDPYDPMMTKEALAARKKYTWEQSKFRKKYLVSEFWGAVIDRNGEMLLPNATMTLAGGLLIQEPTAVPYRRLRWPGVSFSPLPNLLRFGGRGLIEGIISIWNSMNNLMCLHEDNLKWVVMPPMEVNVDGLVDPEDAESWPGKHYLARETANGQQAIRTVDRRDVTNSVLANMQYYDQSFQRGSMVTDAVQGLPGYRQEVTYREASMNLDSALGVFGLMGEFVERGAIEALKAAQDVIRSFATVEDFERMFGRELQEKYGLELMVNEDGEIEGLPEMTGQFSISGIQALLRDQETLSHLRNVVIPLAGDPRFGKYIRPYKCLQALEARTNLKDEKVFVEENLGDQMEQMDSQQQMMGGMEQMGMMGGMPEGGGGPVDPGVLAKLAGG